MNIISSGKYSGIGCSSLAKNSSAKLTTVKTEYINKLLDEGYSIIDIQHTQSEDTRSRTHVVHITYGTLKQKELM